MRTRESFNFNPNVSEGIKIERVRVRSVNVVIVTNFMSNSNGIAEWLWEGLTLYEILFEAFILCETKKV